MITEAVGTMTGIDDEPAVTTSEDAAKPPSNTKKKIARSGSELESSRIRLKESALRKVDSELVSTDP